MGRSAPQTKRKLPYIHPDSPAGGGGPGYFKDSTTIDAYNTSRGSIASTLGPAKRFWVAQSRVIPASAGAKASKPKSPPKTAPFKKPVTKEKNSKVDINIEVEILSDTTGSSIAAKSAKTSFDFKNLTWKLPPYTSKRVGGKEVFVAFTGAFEFKGIITIQTKYGNMAKDTDLSLYGRGTTKKDKRDGNVTLGFHEHCHRKDYLNYLKNNPFPVFIIKVNATNKDYNKIEDKLKADLKKYRNDMEKYSKKLTDEVGYTLSKCKKDGKC